MKKFTKIFLLVSMIIFVFFMTSVLADVGGIQRYDSGSSSSSSSSYSSGGYSSSGGSSGVFFIGGGPGGFIIFLIVVIIIYYLKRKNILPTQNDNNNLNTRPDIQTRDNTKAIAEEIKKIDPMFSEEDFLAWTKEVFIKLQNAWTKRDWSIIRPFESNELFQVHSAQLQEFIDSNKINVVERISVNYAELYSFKQDGDKETLKVTLKAVMRDYIIDATTKEVLEGDKTTDRYMKYRLTFMRKAGVKTKEGTSAKSTTNCPNCGAPTQITSAGKCEYCNSIITTGEHDWVLSNLEGAN